MVATRTMGARQEGVPTGCDKPVRGDVDGDIGVVAGGSARSALAVTKEARRAKERGQAAFGERDYFGAIRHYSEGLKKLPPQGGGAGAASLCCDLLISRASAWLRAGEADRALEDCGEAVRHGGGSLPELWRARGVAHLLLSEPVEAKTHLVECGRLGCTEKSLAFLIDTCDHLARNEELKKEGGPEVDARSQYFRSACQQLIDDDDDDRDIDDVLAEMLQVLQESPSSKLLLQGDEHRTLWKCLLMYFATDSYGASVARIFEEVASGECAVPWPASVVGALLATILASEGEEEGGPAKSEKVRAVNLMEFAASSSASAVMSSWSLAAPSRAVAARLSEVGGSGGPRESPAAAVPLQVLFFGLGTAWHNIPIDCASAFVKILRSYSERAWGAELLANNHIRPLETLVWMFNRANDLSGAFEELRDESIPSHVDRITTPGEAEAFMKRERKRMYNSPVVRFRHTVLDALNVLVRKDAGAFLRSEAFKKKASLFNTGKGNGSLVATNLLPDLVEIIKGLHQKSPLKSTPVLGQDGLTAKEYIKRPFAADFEKNPFGDAFLDESVDSESADKTMLGRALDVLLGCCEVSKNAATTLCSKNIHSGLLADLSQYATDSIVDQVTSLYKKLFLNCRALVTEVAENSNEKSVFALTSLLLTRNKGLQIVALNKLLMVLGTCCGDDFALFCKRDGGLEMCYTLLCRFMHDSRDLLGSEATYKELLSKRCADEATAEVVDMSRNVFLQCLERCRLLRGHGSNSSKSVPRGGAWDTFGGAEILQMESFLLGEAPAAPRERSDTNPLAAAGKTVDTKPVRLRARPSVPASGQTLGSRAAKEKAPMVGFFGAGKGYKSRKRRSMSKKTAGRDDSHSKAEAAIPTADLASASTFELQPASSAHSPESAAAGEAPFIEEVVEEDLFLDDDDGVMDNTLRDDASDDGEAPPDEAAECRRKARVRWRNIPHNELLSWTQTSSEVTVTVTLPEGTRAEELQIHIQPTRLKIGLTWFGRVFDGPLARRVKSSDSFWSLLDGDTLTLSLLKDDPTAWRALFEGGAEKSFQAVLSEMMQNSDEPVPSYAELDQETQDLVDELRERQELVAEGVIDPDIFDDFRLVLSDADGAK